MNEQQLVAFVGREKSVCVNHLSKRVMFLTDASPYSNFSFSWANEVFWYFSNM